MWNKKTPSLNQLIIGTETVEIDGRLHYNDQTDLVLIKKYASAFVGTPLASYLNYWRVDTLIVTGATTSGCVRATINDTVVNGFVPVVVSDAVGDRAQGPHESNLIDMKAKYAEQMTTDEVVSYLNSLEE